MRRGVFVPVAGAEIMRAKADPAAHRYIHAAGVGGFGGCEFMQQFYRCCGAGYAAVHWGIRCGRNPGGHAAALI